MTLHQGSSQVPGWLIRGWKGADFIPGSITDNDLVDLQPWKSGSQVLDFRLAAYCGYDCCLVGMTDSQGKLTAASCS